MYTHLLRLKHKTAHHQQKLALKFSYIIEAQDNFSGERWHNHDNRQDNNNQIYLKTDLSVSCKYM